MLTVSQVARKAKIAPNTVRNHVRDFPDLFSEVARGLQGNRRFTDDDVEALCSLVALKDSGMSLAEAAAHVRDHKAPTVIDVAATTIQEASIQKQAHHEAFAPPSIQSSYSALQRQIEALQRAQRVSLQRVLWSHGVAFYLGMVTMGIIFYFLWWLVNGR